MKLENLHEKEFVDLDLAERIKFLEKYRNDRLFQLSTITEKKNKRRTKRKTGKKKGKEIKVSDLQLAQLKALGLA